MLYIVGSKFLPSTLIDKPLKIFFFILMSPERVITVALLMLTIRNCWGCFSWCSVLRRMRLQDIFPGEKGALSNLVNTENMFALG